MLQKRHVEQPSNEIRRITVSEEEAGEYCEGHDEERAEDHTVLKEQKVTGYYKQATI